MGVEADIGVQKAMVLVMQLAGNTMPVSRKVNETMANVQMEVPKEGGPLLVLVKVLLVVERHGVIRVQLLVGSGVLVEAGGRLFLSQ